ncbi:MAG: glycosyltransferase family 39 protein [Alphaproteobacteria bacterium]|nr:glycosyltransferase family 39 protein [Alphaproteobacteria bacterium]MDE2013241.1 glycosyltransferase family 39 protein [Alphaproteobacteria bacterium]MDE2075110.1 glycosyltransferase family 39 protein [Alphaproteobacteria bacterium]MDE2351062.1 glycosyltransferase family 39 protein [Alphaproteobacteria bacterium]
MSPPSATQNLRALLVAVALLVAARVVVAAVLPLSFDEAYYWLWSKHLALSYYDHPPVIAYAIRAGTMLFGDTAFGVRFLALLCSVGASWAVWRAGAILIGDEQGGARACLFFNLTLMATVETLTATPDAPLMMAAAFFVLALAKLRQSGDGRWWLAVGAAGGLALLSKYTALFLGAGALAWLLFTAEGRRWLASPWLWLGGVLAIVLFTPVLVWNAQHDWISLRFQLGKAGTRHFNPGYLIEFLAGQIGLASPFIFALFTLGLARWRKARSPLLIALAAPTALFFVEHALQARVQGNWPSFLYPALAIAAAEAAAWTADGHWADRLAAVSKRWAVLTAALILAVSYAQALFGLLPVRDPTAHLLASGIGKVTQRIEALRQQNGAAAILTTSYAETGWLAFYLPTRPPVIAVGEDYRWLAAPRADAHLLGRPLLYVTDARHNDDSKLMASFAQLRLLDQIVRQRNGRAVQRFDVYLVSGWRAAPLGRVVNAP